MLSACDLACTSLLKHPHKILPKYCIHRIHTHIHPHRLHTRHPEFADATGHNARIMRQIVGDVDGDAVACYPFLHPHAKGGYLFWVLRRGPPSTIKIVTKV